MRSSRDQCALPDSEASVKLRQELIPRGTLIERTRELMELTIDFVHHPLFKLANATKRIQALRPGSLDVPPEATQVRSGVAFVSGMVKTPLLTHEEERYWFTLMNYLKFRAERNRRLLDLSRLNNSLIKRIDADLNEARRVRNHIVESNLRLVVALARKFSDSLEQLSELTSEGTTPLIRSVELFDVSLGYRFSTYSTWGVRKQMLRYLKRVRSTRLRSVTEEDLRFENLPDQRTCEKTDELANQLRVNVVNRLLASLSEREKFVIQARFGLDGHSRGQTLEAISKQIGLSKERIRQIIFSSVSKLRSEMQLEDLASLDSAHGSDDF